LLSINSFDRSYSNQSIETNNSHINNDKNKKKTSSLFKIPSGNSKNIMSKQHRGTTLSGKSVTPVNMKLSEVKMPVKSALSIAENEKSSGEILQKLVPSDDNKVKNDLEYMYVILAMTKHKKILPETLDQLVKYGNEHNGLYLRLKISQNENTSGGTLQKLLTQVQKLLLLPENVYVDDNERWYVMQVIARHDNTLPETLDQLVISAISAKDMKKGSSFYHNLHFTISKRSNLLPKTKNKLGELEKLEKLEELNKLNYLQPKYVQPKYVQPIQSKSLTNDN